MATVATADEKKKGIDWGGGNRPLGGVRYGKLMMWFFLLSDAFTFSALLISYGMIRYSHEGYSYEKTYQVEQYGLNVPTAHVVMENGVAVTKKGEFYFSQKYWPVPEKVFEAVPFLHGKSLPLVFVGIMTFILIMSSVTMVLAVEAGHRRDQRDVEKWMLWTILGGIVFLGSQAWEWTHFIVGTDGGGALRTSGDGRNLGEVIYGAGLSENQYGPTTFANLFFFITGFHGTHVLSGVIINIIIFYNTVMGIYARKNDYEMVEKVGLYWHFVDLVWVFVFTFFYLV
ncbi:cytochrome c oxidase subunit 3 [uncultured Microscilla sp.]|uniref:cytochrome c oxidase subunit 3 n=1 Tax=uncultured Microscilla sp. TaxID=432653 RepID=UPI00262B76AC|nr:cytochrome c oxidase subunit 3 [uncultured Microscilla sp.]